MNTKCLEGVPAVAGGCKIITCCASLATTNFQVRYVIITDLQKSLLASKTAGAIIYTELLFRYSKTAPKKPLPMVQGTFTYSAPTAVASSSSNPISASVPTLVSISSYTSGGQLCYSWKGNGKDGYGFAKEWASTKDNKGNQCLFHKAKNLYATPPQ